MKANFGIGASTLPRRASHDFSELLSATRRCVPFQFFVGLIPHIESDVRDLEIKADM
jgi:hypothetical protein